MLTDKIPNWLRGFLTTNNDNELQLEENLDANRNSINNLSSLNDARHIQPGTSYTNINTELATPGAVIFDKGNHFLDGRLDIGTNNITIIIEQGATIKPNDSVSTTLTCSQGYARTPIFYSSGYDNVNFIIRGEIDGNDTNVTRPHPVFIDNGQDCSIYVDGGNVHNSHDAFWFVDCDNIQAPIINANNAIAVLVCEGVTNSKIGTVTGFAAEELVDLNAYNKNVDVGTVVGSNVSEMVDVNESSQITIESIRAGDSVGQLLGFSGESGYRFTSKTAIGHSDNFTLKHAEGVATTNRAINCADGQFKNLSLLGLNVKATSDHTVYILPDASGVEYGDITVKGRMISSGTSGRGLFIAGRDASIANVDVIARNESGSGAGAVSLNGLKQAIGRILVEGADTGLRTADVNNFDFTVAISGTGADGILLATNGGTTYGSGIIRGQSLGSGGDDINISSDVDGLRLDLDYGSITNNGTNVEEAQYSAI